ncbi:MAG: hypothetical protein QOE28_1460 [Solirubrobacteraceae bacterium]|nr:hypothetical protein [Solirubrobacteraceae bacterium]
MRRAAAALAIGAALGLSGCDTGPPVSQTRQVPSFNFLEVQGSIDLDVALFNRPEPGVRITAGKKSIGRIVTDVVNNDTLRIRTKSRGLTIGPDPLGAVSVNLGVSALTGLRVEGKANVTLTGLSAKRFALRVNGSGNVVARGRVDTLEAEIDGSADTNLRDLATQATTIRINGSGETDLRVARTLDLVLEGSGNVIYRGHPSVSSRLDGSGNVTQLDR